MGNRTSTAADQGHADASGIDGTGTTVRPTTTGKLFGSCLPCMAMAGDNYSNKKGLDTTAVFAKSVSKARSNPLHRRVTSFDVEVYVKNLFESSRAASSKMTLEHHANLAKNTSSHLQKTRTFEAMHLDAAPFSTAALQEAAFAGEVEAVSRLVRQGYDVNERYGNLETPLHIAAEGGYPLMALEILHHGADVLAADTDGWTPLHHAALQGHRNCVEALLNWVRDRNESGESTITIEDVLGAVDEEGATPLHAAVHVRNYTATPDHVSQLRAVVKLLAAEGASVNQSDYNGWTPLHVAVQTGHVALVEELLENGADDQAEDNEGKVALDYACNSKGTQFRSRQISRLLAGQGAMRTPTERGLSPTTSYIGTPNTGFSPLRSPVKTPISEDTVETAGENVAETHRRAISFSVEPVDLAAALDLHLRTTDPPAHEGANESSAALDPPTADEGLPEVVLADPIQPCSDESTIPSQIAQHAVMSAKPKPSKTSGIGVMRQRPSQPYHSKRKSRAYGLRFPRRTASSSSSLSAQVSCEQSPYCLDAMSDTPHYDWCSDFPFADIYSVEQYCPDILICCFFRQS